MGQDIKTYKPDFLRNTTIDFDKNGRQWTWQVCTEFGWFQVANKDHPMRSTLINPTYWLNQCKYIFNLTSSGPAVDFYNNLYGGLNITGKNIVFVNAAEDPWQYAGMRKIHN